VEIVLTLWLTAIKTTTGQCTNSVSCLYSRKALDEFSE